MLRCIIFLLLALAVIHPLLNGTLFLIALFGIGILSYVIFKRIRFFMLAILFAEICLAAGSYLLSWKGNAGLYNIAHNMSVPAYWCFLIIAAVNIVTVSWCVGLSYHLAVAFGKKGSLKAPVVHVVP
jgi:hypothetical protein